MNQQEIDCLSEALRSQGLTWSQTNFAVSLVRNAAYTERERMRATIADDAYAMTFQTFGQYRSALLKAAAGGVAMQPKTVILQDTRGWRDGVR